MSPVTAPSRAELRLWWTQALAVARLERRRLLDPFAAAWLYLLALLPAAIIAVHALYDGRHTPRGESLLLAGLFQFYYLRLALFFGCLGVFTRLIRGELLERTLHYHFLAPLRREIVAAGKFLGGVACVGLVFGGGLLIAFLLGGAHGGPELRAAAWSAHRLRELGAYELIVVLAVVGFGAVFLLMGLLFRNPAVPGLVFFGWESLSGVLPSWLQRLSVTFYLKPLLPMELPESGPSALFSVVAEPVPAPVAVAGLLCFAFLVVAATCRSIRRMEINYATD